MSLQFNALAVKLIPESFEILSRQLSPNEFTLQRAETYNQVKEILTQGIPDIVFLALADDEVDPYKLCLVLSKAGAAVLVISKTPTRQVLINSAKHGAIDMLVSPLHPEILSDKIESALIKTGRKPLPEGVKLKIDFENAKTPFEKVKVLVKKVDKLLALPFSVIKIIKLCNDPSSNTSDIERPIKSDPAIAAMIMKRANSAVYGGMGPVKSIQLAIVRIGMRSTRNIAASFSVLKLFSKKDKNLGFNRTWFWMHSLTTAICAQLLAAELKHKHPEDAFIAGLLHDIGKMILDDFMHDEYYRVLQKANTESIPIRNAEMSMFDVGHAYIGSKLAKIWEFPSVIVEAIERHHHYSQLVSVNTATSMTSLICVANHMAKALQIGNGGDFLADIRALPLWNSFPKSFPWEKIIDEVFKELRSFIEVLEIPPEHVQITTPKSTGKEVGIFLPHEINYGKLFEIALYRKEFKIIKFSSFNDPVIANKKFDFVVGDFSSVEKVTDIKDFQKKLSKLSDKYIILPATDKDETPYNLDFFWLEKQIEKCELS
ncbi:MAG: HDOD domain-containing protein [Desulfobacteraceae bacterium]